LDDKDDIFAPFRQHLAEDEAHMAHERLKSVDPTLNVYAEYADRWSGGSRALGGDSTRMKEMVAQDATNKMVRKQDDARVSHVLSLAREVNRHASHVLDGSLEDLKDDNDPKTSIALAISIEAARKKKLEDKKKDPIDLQMEMWKSRAGSGLDDLKQRKEMATIPLSISDRTVFFRMNERVVSQQLSKMKINQVENPIDSIRKVDSGFLMDVPYSSSNARKVLEEFAMIDSEGTLSEFGPSGLTASLSGPQESMGSVMTVGFILLSKSLLLRFF